MLKKEITYTDYNGQERTEDFYFNLSKAELIEMQASVDGGLDEHLIKLVKNNNQPEIFKFFKDLVLKAYGEKSDDGRRFVKSRRSLKRSLRLRHILSSLRSLPPTRRPVLSSSTESCPLI